MQTFFDELKQLVRFDRNDEAALRALHPVVAPALDAVAGSFVQRLREHPGTRSVLDGTAAQVLRLQAALSDWMSRMLHGPWDDQYFEHRCRIGRVHVRINLPQYFMISAMNVLAEELGRLIDDRCAQLPEERLRYQQAVRRVLAMDLAVVLHAYGEDLCAQEIRTERLSTFGQLVAAIGQELRNPFAIIETSLFVIRNQLSGDERVLKHVSRISEQLSISNSIVAALLDLVTDRPLVRAPLQLGRVLEDALATLVIPSGVQVRIEGVAELPDLHGDGMKLRQALRNILENAFYATGPTGEVAVRAEESGGTIELTVTDSGSGVAAEIEKRLFEPLISNKRGGTGLGLPLAKRFIERHGGTIAYAPTGQGTRFVIRLPISADAAPARPAPDKRQISAS